MLVAVATVLPIGAFDKGLDACLEEFLLEVQEERSSVIVYAASVLGVLLNGPLLVANYYATTLAKNDGACAAGGGDDTSGEDSTDENEETKSEARSVAQVLFVAITLIGCLWIFVYLFGGSALKRVKRRTTPNRNLREQRLADAAACELLQQSEMPRRMSPPATSPLALPGEDEESTCTIVVCSSVCF